MKDIVSHHRHVRGLVRAAAALAVAIPAALHAQDPMRLGPATREGEPRLQGGASLSIAQPTGEFGQYVNNGVGVNVHGLARLGGSGFFALRVDGDFLQYGSETKRVTLSPTVGGRIRVDLNTTNNIAALGVGPQLMVPRGPVRPYINGSVGFAYFGTESSIKGSSDLNEPFARTTNYDDWTLSYGGGSGVLVPLSQGKRTLVFLDLGARFHNNGRVRYLREGGITDLPNGDIALSVIESNANLWTYHIGVSIGGR
jgi:hypothetical protein